MQPTVPLPLWKNQFVQEQTPVFTRASFVRIDCSDESARNSGRQFFIAMAVTCSEGQIPGLIVHNHDPKEFQTSNGNAEEIYLQKPLCNNASLYMSVIGCKFSANCISVFSASFVNMLIAGTPFNWLHIFHPKMIGISAQGSKSLFEKTTPSWILLTSGIAKQLFLAAAKRETTWQEWPIMYSALLFEPDSWCNKKFLKREQAGRSCQVVTRHRIQSFINFPPVQIIANVYSIAYICYTYANKKAATNWRED